MTNKQIIGLDIGNSSIKAALFTDEGVGEVSRYASPKDVEKAYPNAYFVISSVGKHELPHPSMTINSSTPLPIKIDYETPETLGADRLAGAVGAWSFFPGQNIVIIDGGTCVTFDLVTSDGIYRGGIISPGVDMRLKAMHKFTASLPDLNSLDTTSLEIGKSTKECMQIGASSGLKHEIEGFLESFNKKHGDLQVVTTGGLLPSFDTDVKKPIFASSKIVLTGLYAIWKFNEGN